MKIILTIFAVMGLVAGAAFAGCGKKDTASGALESYDAEAKTIVVKTDDGEAEVTLTASTEVKDKDGNEAEIKDLVGKNVEVISEHGKADSVAEEVGESEEEEAA